MWNVLGWRLNNNSRPSLFFSAGRFLFFPLKILLHFGFGQHLAATLSVSISDGEESGTKLLDDSLPVLVSSRNEGLALLSKLLLVVRQRRQSTASGPPLLIPPVQQIRRGISNYNNNSKAEARPEPDLWVASTEEMSASSFSPAGPAEINSRRRAVANCPAFSSSVGSWLTTRPCPKYSTSSSDESPAEDDHVVQQPSAGPIGKHLELPASSCLLDSLRTSRFHQLSEAA